MLQGMSTPSLKPLRKPSAPAMELKERGDETDLPDIGDAFPPAAAAAAATANRAEEPLDSFACGLLACVGAGEKLECLACGARCDALLGAAPTCDECGAAFHGCRHASRAGVGAGVGARVRRRDDGLAV